MIIAFKSKMVISKKNHLVLDITVSDCFRFLHHILAVIGVGLNPLTTR